MLAGVTGVMCSCCTGVGAGVLSPVVGVLLWRKFIGASGCGVAGGGIDRSTGDGVSPGISPGLGPLRLLLLPPLLRPDAAGKSGVELADFVPRRLDRLLLVIEGMFWGIRLTAACRLREGRPVVFISSLPGETVRLLVPDEVPCGMPRPVGLTGDWLVLYAPSHGLVSGDISSNSSSAGEGSGYGLCMFWKTMFAGAECGAEGMTWGGTKEGCCCCETLFGFCSAAWRSIGGTKSGLGCGGSSAEAAAERC